MGDWSDYFEDFPEENPANQRSDFIGDVLRQRVAREAAYSSQVLEENAERRRLRQAEYAERRRRREAEEVLLLGMRLKDREKAQAELHRSIGGLMEAYAWLDINLGLKIKSYSNSAPEAIALLKPIIPMKHRLDCLQRLVEHAPLTPEVISQDRWKEWVAEAEKVRELRNDYAHGRWINSSLANTEFRFAPLGWPIESDPPQPLMAVSPKQIDERTMEIWKLTRSMDDVLAPYFHAHPRFFKPPASHSPADSS